MKFKFLALTVVVLLGFGVGNTAWGQDYFYTCNDGAWNGTEVWKNTSDCNGAFVSAPNPTLNNLHIIVNNNLTVSGSLSYSTNFGSFTVNGTLIVDGDLSFPDGSADGITVGSSGLLIVKGSLTHGGNGGVQIASGGRLVVYDDANIQCAMTVDGQFNVSGDFNYSGNHTFTLNGDVIVGKDATFTNIGNVAFNTNSYIGVLGNAVFDLNSVPVYAGEMDVIGTVSGDDKPADGYVTKTIETDDPIMDVIFGMDVIAFLTGSDISPNTYTNSSGVAYSGVIWTSDNYLTGCYLNVILSGEIEFSGGASVGQAYFEFSVDDGYTWDAAPLGKYGTGNLYRKDDINAPSHMVKMRLKANGLPAGETVTISNITIAATNEGGEGSEAIVWAAPPPRDICDGEQAVYEINNYTDYSNIEWNVPPSANVQVVSISPNKARCEVRWISSPGTLNVTVSGGSCGGASASITYPINVNKPTDFSASYSKTDISCFGDGSTPNDGSITLSGCGGTGTYSYEWTEWPTANGFEIPVANRNDNQLTNLPEGTYKATVSDGIALPQNLEITIVRPAALSVSINPVKAFLCAADAITGQFDISYSGGTWPYSIKIDKDGHETATYDGTTLTATSGTLTWNPGGTLTYSGLGTGTYTVTLTGAVANACPAAIATLEIVHDIVAPTFTAFPANVQMTMAEYQAAQASMAQPALNVGTGPSILNGTTTQVTRTLASGLGTLHNMSLKFNATQGGGVPVADDQLLVEVSYEGGSWTTLQTYSGAISGDQTIALGMDADGKTNAQVRFTATIATASLIYNIQNVQISGSRFAVNYPTCNDNSLVCSVSYIDSKPQWSDCTGYSNANAEFYIERNWTAVDVCGLPVERTQYLSVGTAPEFTGTFPGDETLDFCNNTPTIKSPTATDVCGAVTVSWEVRNSANQVVGNDVVPAMGDNVTLPALPADAAGDDDLEYTVTWTATDDSHLTYSQNQTITIKPVISFDYFQIASSENICQNEEVTINLKPKGGTGVFYLTSFTPDVTSPDVLGATSWEAIGTGVYQCKVQFGATASDRTFTITVTDRNDVVVTGGCPASLESAPFDVHDLIPTGGISRE